MSAALHCLPHRVRTGAVNQLLGRQPLARHRSDRLASSASCLRRCRPGRNIISSLNISRSPAFDHKGTCLFQHRAHFTRNTLLRVAASAQNKESDESKDTILDNSIKARWQRQWHASSQIVHHSWKLLNEHRWPIVLICIVSELLSSATSRLSNRLTNEVAIRLLSINPADIGPNLWWLSPNPDVANITTGYRIVMFLVFAAGFPLVLAARTIYLTAVAQLCCQHPNTPALAATNAAASSTASSAVSSSAAPAEAANSTKQDSSTGAVTGAEASSSSTASNATDAKAASLAAKEPKGIRAVLYHMASTVRLLQPGVARAWKQVLIVDVLVAAQMIPLQVASLTGILIPWTLPRLLGLVVANPIAALDGLQGRQAIARSKELVQPFKAALALPWVAIFAVKEILAGPLKGLILTALPIRYFTDLPEIPIAIYAAFSVASIVLARMHDLLPVVIYQQGQGQQQAQPAT